MPAVPDREPMSIESVRSALDLLKLVELAERMLPRDISEQDKGTLALIKQEAGDWHVTAPADVTTEFVLEKRATVDAILHRYYSRKGK